MRMKIPDPTLEFGLTFVFTSNFVMTFPFQEIKEESWRKPLKHRREPLLATLLTFN